MPLHPPDFYAGFKWQQKGEEKVNELRPSTFKIERRWFTSRMVASIVLAAAFTTLTIGIQMAGAFMQAPPDPFAAFVDIFPGQPRNALETRGVNCPVRHSSEFGAPAYDTCEVRPATGPFLQVRVALSKDVIRQIEFVPQDTRIRVGDLINMWGLPLTYRSQNVRYYYWTGSNIQASAIIRSERHNILSPVARVSIVKLVEQPP